MKEKITTRFCVRICVAALIQVLALAVSARAAEDAAGAKPDRLVVSLAGVSPAGATERFWSHGMTVVLADRLNQVHSLRRRSTMLGRRKLGLKRGIPFTKDQAVEMGLMVESQRVIHGSVWRTDDGWTVRLMVVTPATGAEEVVEVTAKDWWGACDDTTRGLLDRLGVRLEEEDKETVFRRITDSAEALEMAFRAYEIATEEGRKDEAEVFIRKAIEADGDSPVLWTSLARALVDRKEHDEAEEAARKALELDPDLADPYVILGYVEGGRNNPNLAEGHFRKALEIDPDWLPALQYLAMHLSQDPGRRGEALSMIARAKSLDPLDGQVHAVESVLLAQLGRTSAAEASLREAMRLAEGEPPLFNDEIYIAKAAMALRDLPLAMASIRRGLEAERAKVGRPEVISSLENTLGGIVTRMEPVPVETKLPRRISPAELQKELEKRLTAEELALVENPLAVTPEMVSWAQKQVEGTEGELEKARALFSPMARRGGDRSTVGARTAKQVFALWNEPKNRFSCQEFGKLYVGLARELGFDAFFVSVWQDCTGDFVHHACAAVVVDGQCYLVDPTYLWFGVPHREFSLMDDVEAVALHCSQAGDQAEIGPLAECLVAEKLAPDDAYTKVAVAKNLCSLGRLEEAEEYLDAAEDLHPERWDTRILRGTIAQKKGEDDDARHWFEEALRHNPRAGDGHFLLGGLLIEKGELVEAREHLRMSLAYGRAGKRKEQARQGIAMINELIGQNAESPIARGLKLADADDWDGAAREFQRAVDEQPDSEHAHGRLGVALANVGRRTEGIEHLRQALELRAEGMGEYRGLLAKVLHDEEGFEAARMVLETGLALDPDAAELHEVLGDLLQKEERMSEAIDSYRKVLELEPSHAKASIELAGLLTFGWRSGQAEDVMAAVDFGEVEEPKNLARAAMITVMLGDVARGEELMQRARDLVTPEDKAELMPKFQKTLEWVEGVGKAEERLLALIRSGADDADALEEIDVLLLVYVVARQPYVLDEDAERCFAERRDEVVRQLGERETTTITVNEGAGARERAEEIRKELAGGASIEEAAGEWEVAELARIGARGWNTREDYARVLRKPVFAAEVGEVTEVIDGGKFFAVVVVHAERPAKEPIFLEDAAVRSVVDQLVARGQVEQWKTKMLERLRERVRKEQEDGE